MSTVNYYAKQASRFCTLRESGLLPLLTVAHVRSQTRALGIRPVYCLAPASEKPTKADSGICLLAPPSLKDRAIPPNDRPLKRSPSNYILPRPNT